MLFRSRISVSSKHSRKSIELPVSELQQDAVKLGSLLQAAFESSEFHLTQKQGEEVKERLANILWSIASLCDETGISMESVAAYSATQLEARIKGVVSNNGSNGRHFCE